MAAPGTAPISVDIELSSAGGTVDTHALLGAMLRATEQISDLIFSPGRPPQVEVLGQLIPLHAPGIRNLTPDDTRRIAADLIGNNKQAITLLREQGSTDVSYGIPGLARFRVNVFIQRGSCAVVMRVIPTAIPSFEQLGLPRELMNLSNLTDGIVLVGGSRGSGKSSTMAALLDSINQQRSCHIITIEDPIEFLHGHKRATVHQRELHSDTPSFPQGLRAALRQAPKVILVSELRDRETTETVIEAAETGHVIISSLNTVDAAGTIHRLVNLFPAADHPHIQAQLAKTLRYVVCQRLMPRKDGSGRVAVFELLKVNSRLRECLEIGLPGDSLQEQIKRGATDGMQDFDTQITNLINAGIVDAETGTAHASSAANLRQALESR
jgi:twitching motility protein PilT